MDDVREKAQNHIAYEIIKIKLLDQFLSKGLISQDEYERADLYLYNHYKISEVPDALPPLVDPKLLQDKGSKKVPDSQYVSMTELARQYREKAVSSYVIQSWMRSTNTIEFLHLWEQKNNPLFQEEGYIALISAAESGGFTITPKQWIEKTGSVGIRSNQGKNGGTFAHPEIACAFKSWLSPDFKLEMIRKYQDGI